MLDSLYMLSKKFTLHPCFRQCPVTAAEQKKGVGVCGRQKSVPVFLQLEACVLCSGMELSQEEEGDQVIPSPVLATWPLDAEAPNGWRGPRVEMSSLAVLCHPKCCPTKVPGCSADRAGSSLCSDRVWTNLWRAPASQASLFPLKGLQGNRGEHVNPW